MIGADRIVRLCRNVIGDVTSEEAREIVGREDVDLDSAPLDIEDRATLLRLWSGEVDEITAARGLATEDLFSLLREVILDTQGTDTSPTCSNPATCECSWSRAYRLLRDRGALVR